MAFSQSKMSTKQIASFQENVAKASKNLASLETNFIQTKLISLLENDVSSSGKLYYKRPNLVRWSYNKPNQITNILRGETLYVLEDGKPKKIDLNSNKLIKNMNVLVTNSIQGNMFDDSMFDISYFETADNYEVKFLPKDKKMKRFFEAFNVIFNKKNYTVKSIILNETGGDSTEIQFENMQLNSTLKDSIFSVE